jgi:hypothetical protein
MAVLAAVALTAAAIVAERADNGARDLSLAGASCSSPALTADTSTDTLLGVNATSPSQLASATAEFGHLPILRVYYTGMPDPNAWTTGVQAINHSAVVLSFRSLPQTVLSGADDAALKHFFDTAPTGYPIYYSYYHEPEPLIEAGDFTVAQYKAAWTHIVAIADAAHNPDLKPTMILMSWDLDPASGVDWKNYLPAGNVISVLAWDAYPAGTVHDQDPQPTPPADFMGAAEAASRSVGLPYGFAEFALGTQTDRPQWLAQVAAYLRSSGALFGTLFNSTGYPWMELNDQPSIGAWRKAIADSGSSDPVPAPSSAPVSTPSPRPSSTTAAPSPAPASAVPVPSPSPDSSASLPAAAAAAAISQARIDPPGFTPTGTDHVRILFKLSQPANVAICVLSAQGTILRQLDRADAPAGWSSVWYFGYEENGNLLPVGDYNVLIVATNSGGTTSTETELTIA